MLSRTSNTNSPRGVGSGRPTRTSFSGLDLKEDEDMILDMMGDDDEDDDVWEQAGGDGILGGHDSFDQLSLSSSVMGSSADGEDCEGDEDAMGRAVLGKGVRQRNAARRQGKISPSQARCRLIVIISYVILAMGVTLTIFGFANRSQHEALEQEFDYQANRILDISTLRLEDVLTQLKTLSLSFSAQAATAAMQDGASSSSSCWPFCTISNYESQTSRFLKDTTWGTRGPVLLAVAVESQLPAAWEEYSRLISPLWISESLQVATGASEDATELPSIFPQIYYLHEGADDEKSIDRLAYNHSMTNTTLWPVWMTSLSSSENRHHNHSRMVEMVNYNLLDNAVYRDLMESADAESNVWISPPMTTPALSFQEDDDEALLESTANEHGWPQSLLVAPLYESTATADPIALVSVQLVWHTLFEDIWQEEESADEAASIELILQDDCTGRSFRYWLAPNQPLEFEKILTASGGDSTTSRSSQIPTLSKDWSHIPLTTTTDGKNNTCTLQVHLSASDDWYESSSGESRSAIIYASSSLAIFFIIGILFVGYDRMMTRGGASNTAATSKSLSAPTTTVVTNRTSVNSLGIVMTSSQRGKTKTSKLTSMTSTTREDEDETDSHQEVEELLNKSRHDKAIADLHPHVTVLFADIAHFTAWASVREPAQVFHLLETLYDAFDMLCPKYKIMKVETVGDSYVAVSGIPAGNTGPATHAIQMARFAHDMMRRMSKIVNSLEVALGPDTAELSLRIGIHSGPVVAGVLRGGSQAKFQLFGETYNTASRMEGTGEAKRIQVTQATADLLIQSNRERWLTPRKDLVEVKGRGDIQTYWLQLDATSTRSSGSADLMSTRSGGSAELPPKPPLSSPTSMRGKKPGSSPSIRGKRLDRLLDTSHRSASSHDADTVVQSLAGSGGPDVKKDRLVHWCADLMLNLLKKIVAMRESEESYSELRDFQEIVRGLDEMELEKSTRVDSGSNHFGALQSAMRKSGNNFDELANLASIGGSGSKVPRTKDRKVAYASSDRGRGGRREPKLHKDADQTVLEEVAEIISLPRKTARYQQDPNKIVLSKDVVMQVYRFVREIANMYRDNPFHNFQHASHVTQSLTKLLSRVVAPDEVDYEKLKYKKKAGTSTLHKFTYGITSDPLTQFACAISALIHDVDHPGVPNSVLVQEKLAIAQHYRNQSVAEQNSVDLAWNLLMQDQFSDLRQCIYQTPAELQRFRQLIVNSVMATDIVDKELGQLRKNRWERAFSDQNSSKEEGDDAAAAVAEGEDVNRKATIVIEHLIQASDVSHTMQHWHVYLKWNERFFQECYATYQCGRSETDPSINWYKGEIGFFDFYIIPLARKLESCGVFGVSSDECLSYAQANRDEWERKGQEIVQGYLAKYKH